MSALLRWASAHSDRLAHRTFSIEVIDEVVPGYHDCSAVIRVGRSMFAGRAQARTRSGALSKATGEAVERWLVQWTSAEHRRETTSSGFAVHPWLGIACANARRELVERDLFLCHMLTRTPFAPIPRSWLREVVEYALLEQYLARAGVELQVARLPSESGLPVIVCAAFGRGFRTPFGVVVGFGSHDRVSEALRKALFECWGGLLFVLFQGPPAAMARSEAVRSKVPSIDMHHRFAMHADGARSIRPLFDRARPLDVETGEPPRVETRIWRSLPAPLATCPLYGARCTSADLQPLFFGLPRPEHLNVGRLRRFRENRGLRPRLDRACIHLLV